MKPAPTPSAWHDISSRSRPLSRSALDAQRSAHAVDTPSQTEITFAYLVKDFTKSGDYGTRVRAGPVASRVGRIASGVDVGCLRADAARATDAGEADGV